ncbi:tetratricopeptide repeat protein [Streptomyces cylindrosporus]|uniref:Tetratricopeptide repeat protein n=1 Tax=Streptomyces cylindrosporus TaxID=2927583 RepID=A0ABS9YIM9_9ACTN|nr:tetratricopeptide repeat protein [Streptomyces cylindrosporus]MCI3276415.1 tetratricopeptide repeat protein [Streptomyces cylindrosporus]
MGEWRRPRGLWGVAVAVVGCVVLGGVMMGWPWQRAVHEVVGPAPGARALAAVGAGVSAGLADLAVLIGEREAFVRAHPTDARAWAVLGAAYVEQGRRTADATNYPRGERALRASLKVRGRGNVEAMDGMAALANARRDFRAARTWGEAALKLAPKRWTTYPLLIDAYTGLGDYKATKRTLDRLLELRSGPAVLARAGAVYRDRGWREDAAAALSDAAAAAHSPAERAAWLERSGQLSFERGDLEDALRRFQEAVRIDPDQRAALAGQGRALAGLGRPTEALNAYRVALAKQPCPQYALELGELYESLGLGQAARVQYDLLRARVREEAAGGVDDELVLGVFEADHGDPQSAVRRLRAEWRRQPGIAVADALGWALHRAGNDKEALRYAAVATDRVHGGGVRSAPYMYHRGVIERELEQYGPARRHLQEALRINPYFSPLQVPLAEEALAALGDVPDEPLPTGEESKEPTEKER